MNISISLLKFVQNMYKNVVVMSMANALKSVT